MGTGTETAKGILLMHIHVARHLLFFLNLERKRCSNLRMQLNADLKIPQTLPSVEHRQSNFDAAEPTACVRAFVLVCMRCYACKDDVARCWGFCPVQKCKSRPR
jgi:hypothetical protein